MSRSSWSGRRRSTTCSAPMTRNSPSCSRSPPISRTGSSAPRKRPCSMRGSSAAIGRREKLRPLDRDGGGPRHRAGGAACRRFRQIVDRACARSSICCRRPTSSPPIRGKDVVGEAEVQAAIDAQFRRGDRIYRRLQEEIGRNTIRIETDGEASRPGQRAFGDQPRRARLRHADPDHRAGAPRPRRGRRYRARGRARRPAPFKGCADPRRAFSAAASAATGRCR